MIEDELGVRCNHPKKLWIKPSTGEKSWSPHPPLVGKEWYAEAKEWHKGMLLTLKDAREKFRHEPYLTSAAQAYPGRLNKAFAEALQKTCQATMKDDIPMNFEIMGKWRNVLKRKHHAEPVTTRATLEFSAPLKGRRNNYDQQIEEEDKFWGGMRNPIGPLPTTCLDTVQLERESLLSCRSSPSTTLR